MILKNLASVAPPGLRDTPAGAAYTALVLLSVLLALVMALAVCLLVSGCSLLQGKTPEAAREGCVVVDAARQTCVWLGYLDPITGERKEVRLTPEEAGELGHRASLRQATPKGSPAASGGR